MAGVDSKPRSAVCRLPSALRAPPSPGLAPRPASKLVSTKAWHPGGASASSRTREAARNPGPVASSWIDTLAGVRQRWPGPARAGVRGGEQRRAGGRRASARFQPQACGSCLSAARASARSEFCRTPPARAAQAQLAPQAPTTPSADSRGARPPLSCANRTRTTWTLAPCQDRRSAISPQQTKAASGQRTPCSTWNIAQATDLKLRRNDFRGVGVRTDEDSGPPRPTTSTMPSQRLP